MVSDRARLAVEKLGMPYKVLDGGVETTSGHVSISTMRLAKGLEFRAVAVMAFDDEVIPPPSIGVAQGTVFRANDTGDGAFAWIRRTTAQGPRPPFQ